MEINKSNIFQILKNCDIHPDKDFGQNFLVDPNASKRIVDALQIESNDKVLEIGPGLGSLTHFLSLNENIDLTVVDIDPNMIAFLKVFYKDQNLNIVENDMRKEDVSIYDRIIANLPYNITTEAVIYLLLNAKKAKKMVLMIQSEALTRFVDTKGKDYCAASVLVHLLGNIKKLFNVSKGAFVPSPKVESVVFEINFDESKDREHAIKVYKFAKAMFLNRRKTIYNNLSKYLGDKEKTEKSLNALNIPLNARPEEITPESFEKLYNEIKLVEKR